MDEKVQLVPRCLACLNRWKTSIGVAPGKGRGNLVGGTKNDCFLFQDFQSTVLGLIGM